MIRHAWLQKHATPVTSGGEFHWYPASDATPELVERSRGVTPPAVMWELGPGRVVWTQVFAATAPSDNRRYVGLVASTVEGPGSAADLLHRLVPPPPRPWRDGDGSPGLALGTSRPLGDAGLATLAASAARALLDGGNAAVGDVTAPDLAQLVASLEAMVPERVAMTVRRGVWTAGAVTDPRELVVGDNASGAIADVPDGDRDDDRGHEHDRVGDRRGDGQCRRVRDRVAELMIGAWNGDAAAVRGWRLLGELADIQERTLDGVELDGDRAIRSALASDESAVVGDRADFVRVLHLWGRGQLDRSAGAASLPVRLADVLATRVLASYLDGRDGRDAIAQARWYALLPAARRAALLTTAAARAPSLAQPLAEDCHA